jgi:hypothetical protein
MVAAVVAMGVGASWFAATRAVSGVLGEPPPKMGNQTTAFLWDGAPKIAGHPWAWRFVYNHTLVPGAPNVRIYVTPFGRLLSAEPADLQSRLKGMHRDF